MNSPHYFIALPLPNFLKKQLAGWQRALSDKLPYKQWTHPDDLHITLKFLGPAEQNQLQMLMKSMAQIKRISAFSLQTESLGTFGNPKKPRVLWADVKRKEKLFYLQENVENIASQAGFQHEKRVYTPHITLAKKWTGGMKDLSDLKKRYIRQQTFEVDQVVIYRIHPEKNPKYHVAATFNLSRGEDVYGTAD